MDTATQTINKTLVDTPIPEKSDIQQTITIGQEQRKSITLDTFTRVKGGITKTRIASKVQNMRKLLGTINGLKAFVGSLLGG